MRDDLLLCELHAHTSWSDGALSVAELVDLYGTRGFDVLAITDHTGRARRPDAIVRRSMDVACLREVRP